MGRESYPPRLWRRLFYKLSSEHHRDSAVQDLDELYQEMLDTEGRRAAACWYRQQVIRSLPRLCRHRMRWESGLLLQAALVAWRRMRRDKMGTMIHLGGLTVGLTVVGIVAIWVHYELSYDRFHNDSHRIYRVAFQTGAFEGHPNGAHGDYVPGPAAAYLAENYAGVEAATAVASMELPLSMGQEAAVSRGCFVNPGFFEVFSFPQIEGDLKKAFDQPLSMVLTRSLARRLFGNRQVLGAEVNVGDQAVFLVTGVLEDPPRNSSLQFDFLIPMSTAPQYLHTWQNKAVRAFVRLRPDCDAHQLSREIQHVYNQHNPGGFANDYYLTPFEDMRLHELEGGGRIRYVQFFMLLAVTVLLLAVINSTNLTTAWATMRIKEMGIRRTHGAFRRQLLGQILGESVMLALFAGGLAMILTRLLQPLVGQWVGELLPWPDTLFVGLSMAILAMVTGLAAGAFPALMLSGIAPLDALRGKGQATPSGRKGRLRRVLVIVQFFISIVLMLAVLVIARQTRLFKTVDLGYAREHVLVLPLQGEAAAKATEIKNAIADLPQVEGVSGIRGKLSRWSSSAGLDWPGKETGMAFDTGRMIVDEDFAEVMSLNMLQGRFFTRDHIGDRGQTCVINEALAAKLEMEDPIGVELTWFPESNYEQRLTIVGVVKDFNTESLHQKVRPFILLAGTGQNLHLRVRPGTAGVLVPTLQEIVERMAPGSPFAYHFLDDELDALYGQEHLAGKFLLFLTGLALFIAVIGLVGLSSFSISRCVKEIGIRKVLGASAGEIVLRLVMGFLIWVGVANVLAWPVAWWGLERWLQGYPYRTRLDWVIFAAAGGAALLVAALTVGVQAIKAAQLNPAKSLRDE